jgi:PAS domain S-box-containing protein
MKTLIDSLPAYIYIKDTAGRFLLVNKKLADENNIENPDDMLGKTDFDYYPEKLAQKSYEDEQAIIQFGNPLLNCEEEGHSRDGSLCWVMTSKIPLKDEHGTVFSLVGIGVDITEQKKYQEQVNYGEAMRREKEKAEQHAAFINAIFDNMEDWMYFKDRQSRLLGANKAWVHAKKASSIDDLLGKTELDFFVTPMGWQLYEAEQHQMATGAVTRIREKHIDPDGKVKYIESIKCPMRNEKRVVIGLAGISRDVTRQVENEKELIDARKEAEAARKQAENAAKAKSSFLANMSHEIRTPLNAVIGMTSLLADSKMDEEQRDFVQIIQTSGEALLTLINDILDLSKIEAGALQLEEIPFNLRRCVESSLDIVSSSAFEKGLELACSINGDIPQVFIGDSGRLRQVLLNLLNNAIKFTESGEVVVRVAGTPVHDQHHRLDFSVTDTGIGMTEETAQRIFNPFEQADASTTRKYGGTGLGLSICNKLVEMMGGSLHVKSAIKEGSTFSFNIILRREANDATAQIGINREALRGKRVLIVDDNLTNLKILEAQLREWDVTPLTFSRGQDALRHLGNLGAIDFAILDMMMSEMDGEMLSAALRQRPEFMDRPILILSSTGNTAISENPSANAWLTKPAKPDRLLEKIALLLENAETGRLTHPEKMESKIGNTLGLTHPLRILVAEDNAVNQKVALKLLSRLGYEADMVSNGLESIEAVKNKIYDLVLMDIQMPLMNGLEATQKILQLYPGGNGPKIVAMTAHALQESKEEGIACGMSGYIVKPIRFEALIDALNETSRRDD